MLLRALFSGSAAALALSGVAFAGVSDCCTDNGTPGCDDAGCEANVCSIDPDCCDVLWDAACADLAQDFCGDLCAGAPADCPPATNDCFSTAGTPGCSDVDCCEAVCAVDPFCCETAWDGVCVGEALNLCAPPKGEIECPGDASEEEEACGDATNDGCNLDVPAFGSIACGETICGTVDAVDGTRDTDWYEITIAETTELTFTGTAAFPLVIGLVNTGGVPDCAVATALAPAVTAVPFGSASFTVCLNPGTYWLFVSSTIFEGLPCGSGFNDYVVTLECAPCEIPACDDSGITLTQSNNPTASTGQVACAGGGITTANAFARSFNLGAGSTAGSDFLLTCVDFGVTNSGDPVAASLNIYIDTDGGAPTNPATDLTLIGSVSLVIANGAARNEVVNLPEAICVPADSILVIELEIEASTSGFAVIAGNPFGSPADTFIRAAACGLANYVSYSAIGFPDANWALSLFGDTECGKEPNDCPWDLSGDGQVDGADLGILLEAWGTSGPGDFNGDGTVNGADLGLLLENWGACP